MARLYRKVEKQLEIAQEMKDRVTNFPIQSLITLAAKAQLTSLNTFLLSSYDKIFEEKSRNWNIFAKARKFNFNLYIYFSDDELIARADEEKLEVIAAIDSIIEYLGRELHEIDFLADEDASLIASMPKVDDDIKSSRIFIVHGHNKAPRHEIEILLRSQGLEPIILEQQAGGSITIIEKFEDYSDVGYAVVLLTADDQGKSISEEDLKFRARQNVYLELGFFIGKLERKNVCALRESNVDIPTDLSGIQIEEIDSRGAWKTYLLKALRTAGYSIDLNYL